MAKNTSILLGDYFDKFISKQIKTGKFSSASEVVRAALRVLEQEENKKNLLVAELIKAEKSALINNFDKNSFVSDLHNKHVSKK